MLKESLESISHLIDSSKIIGKPIHIDESKIIIPITKVTLGFGVAGSEFNFGKSDEKVNDNLSLEVTNELYPYGGGQLGGMSLVPEAFLIINQGKSEILYFEKNPTIFMKTLDLVKDILKK